MSRYLSTKNKLEILEKQNHKCIYCDSEINVLEPAHFDHFIPYSQIKNTRKENIFAACPKCNCRKSNKIFNTLKDAAEFLGFNFKESEKIEIYEPEPLGYIPGEFEYRSPKRKTKNVKAWKSRIKKPSKPRPSQKKKRTRVRVSPGKYEYHYL